MPGVVWFVLKVCFVFFMFAMVKAFVPRYRYDQLMRLGWKVFLPLSLAMVVIVAVVLQLTGWASCRAASMRWSVAMASSIQAASSLLLKEFVGALLSCRCAISSSRRRR